VPNVIRHIGKIIPSAEQHPTEKPPELAAWFIQLHSLPGETVLDAFAGSGTTGVACVRTGRKSILIEISEAYCRIIRERMERELAQPCLPALAPEHCRQEEML
jgi:site-specific DNA-methyltransferase (adenine-specific)